MAKGATSQSFQGFTVDLSEGVIIEHKKDGEFPYSINKFVSQFDEEALLSVSLKNIKSKHLYNIIALLDGEMELGMSVKLENGLEELMPDHSDDE